MFFFLKYHNITLNVSIKINSYMNFILEFISIIVILFYFFNYNEIIKFYISILIVFFIPGISILKIIKFKIETSYLEWFLLIFCLSMPISCLIFTAALLLPISLKFIFIISSYLFIAILPIIINFSLLKYKNYIIQLKTNISEILLWTLIISIFVNSIIIIYPNYSSSDLTTTFGYSVLINNSPKNYFSPHPWFEYLWSIIYYLIPLQPNIFILLISFLAFFLIISFYLMSKIFSNNIDNRIPILSTLIYFLSSGIGWVYFLKNNFTQNNYSLTEYEALMATSTASYWDVWCGSSSWLWIWFRSITVGAIIYFTLIYLIKRTDLSKRVYYFISILLIITIGMIHLSELIQYSLILFTISIFYHEKTLRIRDSIISLIFGTISLYILTTLLGFISLSNFQLGNFDLLITIFFSFIIYITWYSSIKLNLDKLKSILNLSIKYIILLSIPIYLFIMVYWYNNVEPNFDFGNISPVPWEFYPVLLGFGGLLGLLGIVYILNEHSGKEISIFIFAFFVIIIFGKLLSFLNLNLTFIGYNERRLMPFIFSSLSIFAPIPILKISDSLLNLTFKIRRYIRNISLICLIIVFIISTFSSTFLVILTQKRATLYALNDDRVKSIEYISNKTKYIPLLLTDTDRSFQLVSYLPIFWKPTHREMFWAAQEPTLPLELFSTYSDESFIYLTKQGLGPDMENLEKQYSNGFLFSYLLNNIPYNYSNPEVDIYKIPPISPPVNNSRIGLVISDNYLENNYFAYTILSYSRMNYTSILEDDVNTISKCDILIVPNEELAQKMIDYKILYNLPYKKLIVLNLNGYENLSSELFNTINPLNVTSNFSDPFVTINKISKNEFSVKANSSLDNFYPLYTNNSYKDWIATVMAPGKGVIGSPLLSEFKQNNSQNSSLKLTFNNGDYGYWKISTSLKNVDLYDYDFFTFYMYGNKSNKNYFVTFFENDKNNIIYRFNVDWDGWKKIVLSLNISDGKWCIGGVNFSKSTTNVSNWKDVIGVEIGPTGDNINDKQVFYFSDFKFEKSMYVNLNISLKNNIENTTKIYNFNSTKYILQSSNFIQTNNLDYYFNSGLEASKIFKNLSNIKYDFINKKIIISLYLIPSNEEKVIFKIEGIDKYYSDEIIGKNFNITFPVTLNLTPLINKYKTLAYYSSEQMNIPYVSEKQYNNFTLIYFNVFPITHYIQNKEIDYRQLSNSFKSLIKIVSNYNSTYNFINNNVKLNENMIAFNNLSFKGIGSLKGSSAIIYSNETMIYNQNEKKLYKGNIKLTSIKNNKIKIDLKEFTLQKGSNFYLILKTKNATITYQGEPSILEISNNGLTNTITENMITVYAKNLIIEIRQPEVTLNGNGTLYKFHALGDFKVPRRYDTTEFYGDDASFDGKISFKVINGDVFSIVQQFKAEGVFSPEKNAIFTRILNSINDNEMIITILPYYIILFVIILMWKKLDFV